MVSKNILRRYTSLSSLLHLLTKREITLLSPASWDDTNDTHFIERYRKERRLQSVLVLCFSETSETYHHWRVFTKGTEGVCIEFHRDGLLRALPDDVRCERVKYVKITDIAKAAAVREDLPFLKRYPFRDEREFRLLCEDPVRKRADRSFPIPITTIRRVTFNPWIHDSLYHVVRGLTKEIDGCEKLKIHQTTLIHNERWKAAAFAT